MEPMPIALRKLMRERGMTVRELSVLANLGGTSGVYRYLRRERGVSVNSQSAPVIERMAEVLGVPPDYFMEFRAWKVREVAKKHPHLVDEVYDLLMAHAEVEEEQRRSSSGT